MELKDMIARRRSVRKYTDRVFEKEELEQLEKALAQMKPLDPEILVSWEILDKEQVRYYFPWKPPLAFAIYSAKTEGCYENVGFLFQQMDLYLQSMGLGSCWIGLGKPRKPREDLEFVVLLGFGEPGDTPLRAGPKAFKRKTPAQIADREDPRLESARLAPSSTNSQPWYFTHDGDTLRAWCSTSGLRRHTMMGVMNRIDMGIALAHLYVSAPDTFRFFREEDQEAEGCLYIGSFTL